MVLFTAIIEEQSLSLFHLAYKRRKSKSLQWQKLGRKTMQAKNELDLIACIAPVINALAPLKLKHRQILN